VEVVRKAVQHREKRECGDGDEEGLPAPDEVGDDASEEAARGHADEVPERDHADVGHLQAPCMHERGGDEAEVPVVHLLAEVGHHDDEEDDFVEAGYGHSIKIVVGDLLDCRLAHSRFSKSRLCARVFDAVFRFLYPDYIAGKNTAFGNHRCFSLKRYEVEQLPVTMLREKEECLIQ